MTLPTALAIGPMKAGTTWIYEYLAARGDVNLPRGTKETFFFDRHYDKGADWYLGHFNCYKPGTHVLSSEVATSYFHHPEAPQRVRSTLGDIRLIVTLRDPVKRAWSHYLHLRRYGFTRAPLREAAAVFPEIVEASRYEVCLQRWYAEFSKSNVHFLWMDDLIASPDSYAERVCEAFGLNYEAVPEHMKGRANAAAVPASYRLAAMGSKVTIGLRRLGLYGVINTAKRLGLKRLFYGKPGSARGIQPTAEDRNWLTSQLVDVIPEEAQRVRNANTA